METVKLKESLWRKMMKKVKKNSVKYSSKSSRYSYDPSGYAQNFDEGKKDDADISQSFSARYARTFNKDDNDSSFAF
ncbi:hypothetical protein Leryth_006166 [Lithospermum erythrorhizon]|nr:hypothetical protein Leryth_006166 [Lithospermum erythrorhizon]